MDYETRVFDSNHKLKLVITASCSTDTAALTKLVRMGITDYQKIEIWRELECIYSGREIKCSNRRD